MPEPLRQSKPAAPAPSDEPPSRKSALREYTEAFLVALVLALILRTFFIQAYKIPSGSMEPTLLIGDHIIVDKLDYGFRLPDSFFGLTPLADEIPWGHYLFKLGKVHRQDVVVFVYPQDETKDFIKRVIALPGDTVEVRDGIVYLNGKRAPDSHAHFDVPMNERQPGNPRDFYGPVTLPPGEYFMMGDNRDHSYDSRFWGFVNFNQIEGRALFIYWSWNADSTAIVPIRWSRFFKVIH
ncbi:MAG TPA: signal peptidase I [Candidatus Binataceae bacterium]|nr:signal peptidase I [Candidatus Binataceae bacterium]